jgi:hypothetical protein
MEAAPPAEEACQSRMSSGTNPMSLVIVSMTVVRAFFRERHLAISRHASKRPSMESRASSYASTLSSGDSDGHSKPKHAAKEIMWSVPGTHQGECSKGRRRKTKSLRNIILSIASASAV